MQSVEIASLEFLDRLCERGEALVPHGGFFYSAQELVKTGLAEVVGTWGGICDVIQPSALGRQLNEIRRNLLARGPDGN